MIRPKLIRTLYTQTDQNFSSEMSETCFKPAFPFKFLHELKRLCCINTFLVAGDEYQYDCKGLCEKKGFFQGKAYHFQIDKNFCKNYFNKV